RCVGHFAEADLGVKVVAGKDDGQQQCSGSVSHRMYPRWNEHDRRHDTHLGAGTQILPNATWQPPSGNGPNYRAWANTSQAADVRAATASSQRAVVGHKMDQ